MSQDKMVIDRKTNVDPVVEGESLTSVSISSITADARDAARKQQANTSVTAEGTPDLFGLGKVNLGGGLNKLIDVGVKYVAGTVLATPETRAKQESAEIKNELARRQIATRIEAEELRNQQQEYKNRLAEGQVTTKLRSEDLKNTQLEQRIVTDFSRSQVDLEGKRNQVTESKENSDMKQLREMVAETLKLLKESYQERQKIYADMMKNATTPEQKQQIAERALKDNDANQAVLMQLTTRLTSATSPTSAAPTAVAPTGVAPDITQRTIAPTGGAPTGAAPTEATPTPQGWTPTQPLPSSFSREEYAPGRPNVPARPLSSGIVPSEYTLSGKEKVGQTFQYNPFQKKAEEPQPEQQVAPKPRQLTDENIEDGLTL